MGKDRRFTIRLDERTGLILDELSEKTGANRSRLVCALLQKSVEELLDKEGNLNINGTQQIPEE